MVSLNRLLLASEGTHLDSSFNFYCMHTPSRVARTLAGVDRRKAGVETIKERRGGGGGGGGAPPPPPPQNPPPPPPPPAFQDFWRGWLPKRGGRRQQKKGGGVGWGFCAPPPAKAANLQPDSR